MKKVLLIVFTIAYLYSCNNDNKVRVYLIPKEYEGPIVLIQNDKTAKNITVRNDTLFFDFTKSPVYRSKSKFIEGTYNTSKIKYYYIDSLGKTEEIKSLLNNDKTQNENEVYIYPMHSQIRENSQCDLLSTPKHLDYYIQIQQRLCDSLFSIHVNN